MYGLESAAATDPGSAEKRGQEPFSVPGRFQPPTTGVFTYLTVNMRNVLI